MFHAEVEATSRCQPRCLHCPRESDARAEIAALREVVALRERTLMLRDAELASLHDAYHRLRRSWPNRTARALGKDLQRVRDWLLGTNSPARYPQKVAARGSAI